MPRNKLSFVSLNVNGCLESKLECVDFIKYIKGYDVIILSECWTNKFSKLDLEGYSYFSKHRPRRKKAKRDSGGLVCYLKNDIYKGVNNIDWDYEDGMVLNFNKVFFGYRDNIYVIVPYIKPESSSRNLINDDIDTFDKISDKVAELSTKGEILILCDLNARIGELNDFVPLDEENTFDMAEEIVSEKSITHDDVTSKDMLIERVSQDVGVNENGHKLINFCKSSEMLILNGRSFDDKGIGKFTFCNKRGRSVIDYAICSKGILKNVSNFYVSDMNAFSDHAKVCLTLCCNIFTQEDYCDVFSKPNVKAKWKPDKKDTFTKKMMDPGCANKLRNILSLLNDSNIDDSLIENCVNCLNYVFHEAGESHKVCFDGSKSGGNKNEGGWYDLECQEKRDLFRIAERQYRLSGSNEDRVLMCEARRIYKQICKAKRRLKQIEKSEELTRLSVQNQKLFWQKIRKKSNDVTGNCNFHEYFKNINNVEPFLGPDEEKEVSDWEKSMNNWQVDCLDKEMSMKELDEELNKLKTNKAPGLDSILNEFLVNSCPLMKEVLLKLFNSIFSTGCFPSQWATGEIIPIYKKGDKNNPENYRGVTLISAVGKLFTSILNTRLNDWAETYGILCEIQFGFRRERGTADCMFILHGLIEHLFCNSKQLYCAFVDLQRAFDLTNRRALWYKLNIKNVSSKMIDVIRNMYSKIKLCVRSSVQCFQSNDLEDKYFISRAGVFQGESLSPLLFSLFINDLETSLKDKEDVGISLEQCLLTIILFADDMVIFSETRKGLQNGLDALSSYCSKWGLSVNVSKTKCIAFKRGGRIGAMDRWTYNGEELETVNQFKYLGFVFGSSGKFCKGIQALHDVGLKSLFGLKTVFHKYPDMSVDVKLKLFNAIVLPRITYGCEIWGFCEADKLEKLYLGFLKSLLGVKKNTPTSFIYSELGVYPLLLIRLERILKFWLKILNLKESNPVKIIYNTLVKDLEEKENVTNWAGLLKHVLNKNGFGNIWIQQHVANSKRFLYNFNQRLRDIFLQSNRENINSLSEHRLYYYLSPTNSIQGYLSIPEKFIRVAIARLRVGSHNFMVERGRWQRPKVEYIARLCDECGEIEDSYHVILICPRFLKLRKKYLPEYLYKKPSMFLFTQFLNNAKGNFLRLLGLLCHNIFIEYNAKYL